MIKIDKTVNKLMVVKISKTTKMRQEMEKNESIVIACDCDECEVCDDNISRLRM